MTICIRHRDETSIQMLQAGYVLPRNFLEP